MFPGLLVAAIPQELIESDTARRSRRYGPQVVLVGGPGGWWWVWGGSRFRTPSISSSTSSFPTHNACSIGGLLLAAVGVVIGAAGLIRIFFYKDPVSD